MEQPRRENAEDDMKAVASWFKCQQCGFTCTRLNVIVWHNKSHLSKVCNYDSGIKLPGRRRRKPGASRGGKDARKKGKERKGKENMEHAHTNGDIPAVSGGGKKDLQDTQQILMDWDDEDDTVAASGEPGAPQNTVNKGNASDGGYSDADDDYPPPQPRYERRPMPKAADLNSAFDALLAATHTHSSLNTSASGPTNNYVNNDSDSDYSDWEKYYARDSGSGSEEEEEVEQESDIKSLCEGNAEDDAAGTTGEEERIEEAAAGSTDHTRAEEPIQEQEPEKMDAAPSPRPVSESRISPSPKTLIHPCPDLTPEPECDQQQQEECMQPTVENSNDLGKPVEEVEDGVEEVAENMEMEEEVCHPPSYHEEEVTRELPQPEEELVMATEEVGYYEESDKNSNEGMQSLCPPILPQQSEDVEVAAECAEPCQENVPEGVNSFVGGELEEEERPISPQTSVTHPDIEQSENKNRLSRYIDEFSDTMVAKDDVNVSPIEYSRGLQQNFEASTSPRPLQPGQDRPVSASPARSGDVAATSNAGTTYMLVAVDAHGNTVPTVPTPALGEGGNDLVRVEATMEDGTTRTLYIDPAHLGPNVDLNNLMLHIDTTGQEHVIIPSSSSSDSEGPPVRPAPPVQCSPGHEPGQGDYASPSSPAQPSPNSHALHPRDIDS